MSSPSTSCLKADKKTNEIPRISARHSVSVGQFFPGPLGEKLTEQSEISLEGTW